MCVRVCEDRVAVASDVIFSQSISIVEEPGVVRSWSGVEAAAVSTVFRRKFPLYT